MLAQAMGLSVKACLPLLREAVHTQRHGALVRLRQAVVVFKVRCRSAGRVKEAVKAQKNARGCALWGGSCGEVERSSAKRLMWR